MEPTPTIDYALIIADLKQRRNDLDSVIPLLERLHQSGALRTFQQLGVAAPDSTLPPKGPVVGPPAPPASIASDGTVEVRSDEFFGMSISGAAQKYLGMKKKPAGTMEIASALERGGYPHQSAKLANTIHTVLTRNSTGANAIFAKVKRGTWGLRSWYGNRPSSKDAKDDA